MTSKHRKTLKAILHVPVKSSIMWDDIEVLLMALGAEQFEGNGSRVRFLLNGIKATFHRPHPQKETDKGAIKSVRRFLEEGGIRP
jgi:HicA toxin of bacterial toxin-antitoxin,